MLGFNRVDWPQYPAYVLRWEKPDVAVIQVYNFLHPSFWAEWWAGWHGARWWALRRYLRHAVTIRYYGPGSTPPLHVDGLPPVANMSPEEWRACIERAFSKDVEQWQL